MRRRVPVLICALILVATACGAATAAAQPADEETRLEAQLQEDGDARWSIVATVPLEDEDDVRHFRSFADSFEEGERDFQLGSDTFREAAAEASRASGREMSIHSEVREATIVNETEDGEDRRYGKLRVSFTWDSFARVDENGTMYVDDAFNTTDGTWLRTLEEDQTLVIKSPPGYGGPSTAPIGAQEGDLRWEGPRTFEQGYFKIVYPPTNGGLPIPISTLLLAGAVLLSGSALLLGVYLLWGRDEGSGTDPTAGTAGAAAEEADADPSGEDSGTAAGAAGGAAAAGAAADEPDEEAEEEEDLELLSDEERVEYLLEQNGGRMKQANIVKETGWSNAKVSQLLSSMEEEERIDKLRIGRENLISLPGENVGDLAAGHDEE